MQKKSEALDKFKIFEAYVEKQTGELIKSIRIVNRTEYTHSKFDEFLEQNGIDHGFSAPYTDPTRNVEVLKLKAKLPDMLWAKVICTAALIRNR